MKSTSDFPEAVPTMEEFLPFVASTGDAAVDRKRALALRVLDHLQGPHGTDASFRALAAAAGVTRPTLVHHFGDREGTIRAALEVAGLIGKFFIDRLVTTDGEPGPTLTRMVLWMVEGWEHGGLRRLHEVGMASGFGDAATGEVYRDRLLDATLAAYANRLAHWQASGRVRLQGDPLEEAVVLIAPVLLMLMRTTSFGDQVASEAAVRDFTQRHVAHFVAARHVGDGSART